MEVKPLPAVPYIKIPDEGEPYLEGYKCGSCGATFLGERATCSKCGARDQMSTTTLPTRGKLYSYSIVYRSFPGIDVPASIEFDMPVEVIFADALGRKDQEGNSYLSYFFQPAS